MQVLRHDGDPPCVDRAQVGVLEKSDQISLRCLLQRKHCLNLEPQVDFVVLGDLSDQPLEGQLSQEQVRCLLIFPDLSQGEGSWPEFVCLLRRHSLRPSLARGITAQLFRRLDSGEPLRCLLSSGH